MGECRLMKEAQEFCNLFNNPPQWSNGRCKTPLPGSDRHHVYHLCECTDPDNIAATLEAAKIHSIALIGISPAAWSVGLALKHRQFKVTLIASGSETAYVKNRLQAGDVGAFFQHHGIILHPNAAKSLQGSQIHCQSGYCGFVCEGRFIKESEEVGCVITESGNVYADAVMII